MLMAITSWLSRYGRYAAIVSELRHYTDRELADIGISRFDIEHIAWEGSRPAETPAGDGAQDIRQPRANSLRSAR